MVYYNDLETGFWLRNLADAGLIGEGMIDERSICDIHPGDLAGFERVHLFAGIGGWELALDLAGWEGPVWTGSCPCQPFSVAGKRQGSSDERHLWPEMLRLIEERRPPTIFGEQVASSLGRSWLAGVRTDLEALGYAVGAADLCAASVGAPHIRQRLFWVGDLSEQGPQGRTGRQREYDFTSPTGESPWSRFSTVECTDRKKRRFEPGAFPLAHGVPARVAKLRGLGNAIVPQVAAEFVMAFMEAKWTVQTDGDGGSE